CSSGCAGSPFPLDCDESFDLAEHLIQHENQTFYVRVSGNSMEDAGINDGDILVVDRALKPKPRDVVIANTGTGFTVKKLQQEHARLRLVAANRNYDPIEVDQNTRIWGVVTYAIHKV